MTFAAWALTPHFRPTVSKEFHSLQHHGLLVHHMFTVRLSSRLQHCLPSNECSEVCCLRCLTPSKPSKEGSVLRQLAALLLSGCVLCHRPKRCSQHQACSSTPLLLLPADSYPDMHPAMSAQQLSALLHLMSLLSLLCMLANRREVLSSTCSMSVALRSPKLMGSSLQLRRGVSLLGAGSSLTGGAALALSATCFSVLSTSSQNAA